MDGTDVDPTGVMVALPMTFKELAQSELFVTDEKSAVAWLRQQLKVYSPGATPLPGKTRRLAPWSQALALNAIDVGRAAESVAFEDLSHAPELFAIQLPASRPRAAAGLTKHVEGVGRTVLALDQ